MIILSCASSDSNARDAIEFISARRVLTSMDLAPFLGLSYYHSTQKVGRVANSLHPSKVDAVLVSKEYRYYGPEIHYKFGRFFAFRLIQEVRPDIDDLFTSYAPTFGDLYSRVFNYKRGPVSLSRPLPKDVSSPSFFSYSDAYPELSLSFVETLYAKAELMYILEPDSMPFSNLIYNLSEMGEKERQAFYDAASIPSSYSDVLDALSFHEGKFKLEDSSPLNNEVKAAIVLESRLKAIRALGLSVPSVLPSIIDHIRTLYGVDYKDYINLVSIS